MKINTIFYSLFCVPLLMVLFALPACTDASSATAVAPTATPDEPAPAAVIRARNAVLDFLRTSANICVPPEGVHWQTSTAPEKTPAGFGIYRFYAEECTITVSYALNEAEPLYNIALSHAVTGFCWQAVVDSAGHVVKTGNAAQIDPVGNPAAIYCAQQGYNYEIRTLADGTECGSCVFPDGSACKGWDFFHGTCQPGDNPAEE